MKIRHGGVLGWVGNQSVTNGGARCRGRGTQGTRRAIAVLALAPALISVACSREPAEVADVVRPVRAIQVSEPQLLGGRWFPGAEPTEQVNLAFEVAGQLIARPAEVGDVVEQEHVLARLDPRDYENDLAASQARLDRASAYRERIAQAAETGAVAQQELTDAQAQHDAAVADVAIKSKALDDTVIRAPFKGTITATYVENYQNVRAKQAVLRLVDISKIEMWVDIPEQLISRAPFIESLRVGFDAFTGRELVATIKELGQEASQATRTYPVNLIMDQPSDFTILPGMAGEVQANIELPADYAGELESSVGVEIPLSAVFSDQAAKKSYVWIVDDKSLTVRRREVRTGRISDAGILVREGLSAGEWVVIAGVDYLQEGLEVKLPEKASQASPSPAGSPTTPGSTAQ